MIMFDNLKKLFGKEPLISILALIYFAVMITVSIQKSQEITEDSDH